MIRKLIFVLLLVSIALGVYTPVRPPEPVVPFPYDPNQVKHDILFAFNVRPSNTLTTVWMKVTDSDGDYGVLTCNNPEFTVSYLNTIVDPNDPEGVSRIHNYLVGFRAGTTEMVLYPEFTFTEDSNTPYFYVLDPNGVVVYYPNGAPPQSDSRNGLVDVKKINHRPVIGL